MKKFLVMACILCFTVLGSTTAAHAAPPSNDEIGSATPITELPFTDIVNNAEAVYAESDLDCGLATVWYQFTPSEDTRYRFSVTSSDYYYYPSLAVATGDPASLEPLSCNYSYYSYVETVVELDAGQTYYIEAGTCCAYYGSPGQVGPGSDLTFTAERLSPPISDVEVTIDSYSVDRFGLVTLTGTVSCNQQGYASMYIRLQQRYQRTLADGYGTAYAECGPEPASWTTSFTSSTPIIFDRGRALLTGSVTGYDNWSGYTEEIPAQEIRLRRSVA